MNEQDLDELEKQINELEASGLDEEMAGFAKPSMKDGIYKFFRELLHTKDSKKIGNLREEEIGKVRMGVRHYLDLALYAEAENLNKVGDYLRAKGENILATSMSRKGFLSQLFVTQIKRDQKVIPQQPQKKGLFGGGKQQEAIQE